MIIYAICLVVGVMFTLGSAVAGHFLRGGGWDVGVGGHEEAAPEQGRLLDRFNLRLCSFETSPCMGVNPA